MEAPPSFSPLYVNSLWLLLAQASNYGFGFLFWVLAARLYTPTHVGIAAAILPMAAMMAFIGELGLGPSLIRFMAARRAGSSALVNQALTLATVASGVLAVTFVLGLGTWSPQLEFIRRQPEYLVTFVLLVVLSSAYGILGPTFIAARRGGYALALSLTFGLARVLGIIVLASITSLGIILSWMMALTISVACAIVFFLPRVLPKYSLRPQVQFQLWRHIGPFSLANYVADGLSAVPNWVLPILVLNTVGAEQNAYFSVAWAVGMLPFAVPTAIATAMFAEGSSGEERIAPNLLRSLLLCGLILLPGILVLILASHWVLLVFGAAYANAGQPLLATAAFAVLPGTVTVLTVTVARIRGNLPRLVLINGLVAVGTLVTTHMLLAPLGIIATGIALLVTHGLIAAALLPSLIAAGRASERATTMGRGSIS